MRKIHVHALAESVLIDIWQYSFEEWGEIQADKYLDKLTTASENWRIAPSLDEARLRAWGFPLIMALRD